MTSIVLTDAYFSVPIVKRSGKFLRFQWPDMLLEFQCLCFGLSLAPYFFTKVMKPVFSRLRQEGILCWYYLDDSLYVKESYQKVELNTQKAIRLLESLGFTINLEKSNLKPSVEIIHLAFKINSLSQMVSLLEEKVAKTFSSCKDLLTTNRISIRHLAQVIGLLVSSFMAVNHGQLHYRCLEIYKTQCLKNTGCNDALITLDKNSRQDLLWWILNVSSKNVRPNKNIIGISEWQYEFFSDASCLGWGATLCLQG